jgi:O-antigen/teichoic acid export membrane protein
MTTTVFITVRDPTVGTGAASGDVLRTPEAGARVIRGGVLRGGGYGLGVVIAAVTSVFLLRALGVDDFGRYASVVALLGIVSTVTDAGLTAIGSRELALRSSGSEREGLLRQLVALRVLLTAAGVVLATVVAWAIGYDGTMVWGTLLAGIGVLLVNTQATAMMPLSVELRLGWVTTVEVLRQALTLVGVVVLAVAGASLLPYFAVQILVGVGVLAITPALLGNARALAPRLDRVQARFLLREALPVAVALAMNVVYLRLLVVLVSVTKDETTTGLYATSFRVFELLIGIPAIVLAVALPVLAVAGSEDRDRLRYSLQRLTEVALLVSCALALATVAFAPPAIRLLFGSDYEDAAPILRIQAWALVPLFVSQVVGLALLALRRQRVLAEANAVAVVVVLVLGLALIPAYGGEGAAVAGVVTEVVLLATLLFLLARAEPDVLPSFAFAWRPAVAVGAGIVPLLVPGLGQWIGAAASVAAFAGVALLVRAMPYEVLEALRGRAPGDRP